MAQKKIGGTIESIASDFESHTKMLASRREKKYNNDTNSGIRFSFQYHRGQPSSLKIVRERGWCHFVVFGGETVSCEIWSSIEREEGKWGFPFYTSPEKLTYPGNTRAFPPKTRRGNFYFFPNNILRRRSSSFSC